MSRDFFLPSGAVVGPVVGPHRRQRRPLLIALLAALTGCSADPDSEHRPPTPTSTVKEIRFTLAATDRDAPLPDQQVLWFIDGRAGITPADAQRQAGETRSDAAGRVSFRLPTTTGLLSVWANTRDGVRPVFSAADPDEGLDDASRHEKIASTRSIARVRVITPERQPVRDAKVTLVLGAEAGPDPFLPVFTTGIDGTVTIPDLYYDCYWVDVAAEACATARAPLHQFTDDAAPVESVVTLDAARSVALQISVGSHPRPPVFNIHVDYSKVNYANAWWCVVDGQSALISVPADREFSLRVEAQGFAPWTTTVDDHQLGSIAVSLKADPSQE